MFAKVIELFKNYPATFTVFLEKMSGQKHLPTPDPLKDFAGLFENSSTRLPVFSKIVRQSHRTFSKKFNRVTGLFKNCPAKSANFLKIVQQCYRSF
jgi:hypothetical protein